MKHTRSVLATELIEGSQVFFSKMPPVLRFFISRTNSAVYQYPLFFLLPSYHYCSRFIACSCYSFLTTNSSSAISLAEWATAKVKYDLTVAFFIAAKDQRSEIVIYELCASGVSLFPPFLLIFFFLIVGLVNVPRSLCRRHASRSIHIYEGSRQRRFHSSWGIFHVVHSSALVLLSLCTNVLLLFNSFF